MRRESLENECIVLCDRLVCQTKVIERDSEGGVKTIPSSLLCRVPEEKRV